jgi:hypothetical protein
MRLDWAHAAVTLEVAIISSWQASAQAVRHPLSTAAALLIAFLTLTWWRAQLSDQRCALGHDNEV